jgi:hypothetical protein
MHDQDGLAEGMHALTDVLLFQAMMKPHRSES